MVPDAGHWMLLFILGLGFSWNNEIGTVMVLRFTLDCLW